MSKILTFGIETGLADIVFPMTLSTCRSDFLLKSLRHFAVAFKMSRFLLACMKLLALTKQIITSSI